MRDGSSAEKERNPGYAVYDDSDSFVIAGIERTWHIDRSTSDKNHQIFWVEQQGNTTEKHYLILHENDIELNDLKKEAELYGNS